MKPSSEVIRKIKATSPSEFEKSGKIIYESKGLDGYLSVTELRQLLYILAEAHLLSMTYISKNAAGNAPDAVKEVYDAVKLGIFVEADPNASTMKMYYRINSEADAEIIRKWLNPRQKSEQPTIKKYSEVVRPIKHYSYKRRKISAKFDSRGESNRIANDRPKQKYESVSGDMSPDKKPPKDEYNWSDKTSKKFGRDLSSGKIRKMHEDNL